MPSSHFHHIKCSKIASVEDSLVNLLDVDAVFDVMLEN